MRRSRKREKHRIRKNDTPKTIVYNCSNFQQI